ncbi:MAG: zinc ribbon domain-containing protein [Acidobacteria bacterium]|nr:zinc ribbon domain-containing protein [Acidobacteriota bacterium]
MGRGHQGDDNVASAQEKFHCPACGAEAHWNPGKQALICPFCATESPATLQTRGTETVIVEHDLVTALRGIDDARGWNAEKTSVRCQSCQAISVFDAGKIGKLCDFCGSSQLVPYAAVKDVFRPESLLSLKISEPQARDIVRQWYGRQWLAPNKLRSAALTDTVKALYLPYWTFDANAHASWTAEAGHYYYTTENGKQVRRVRWTPASGEVSHVFDDKLVPASKGVHAEWLDDVEPFPTNELIPYDAGYLAGWTVERYQIDLVSAAARSRQEMEEELRELCASQVPGDTYRNLDVSARFTHQKFKHILVPVWLLTYMYGGKSYQVVINGVTGKTAGAHPWSWIKIALLVIVAVLVLYFVSLGANDSL